MLDIIYICIYHHLNNVFHFFIIISLAKDPSLNLWATSSRLAHAAGGCLSDRGHLSGSRHALQAQITWNMKPTKNHVTTNKNMCCFMVINLGFVYCSRWFFLFALYIIKPWFILGMIWLFFSRWLQSKSKSMEHACKMPILFAWIRTCKSKNGYRLYAHSAYFETLEPTVAFQMAGLDLTRNMASFQVRCRCSSNLRGILDWWLEARKTEWKS